MLAYGSQAFATSSYAASEVVVGIHPRDNPRIAMYNGTYVTSHSF